MAGARAEAEAMADPPRREEAEPNLVRREIEVGMEEIHALRPDGRILVEARFGVAVASNHQVMHRIDACVSQRDQHGVLVGRRYQRVELA
jgi:hypothetical protein